MSDESPGAGSASRGTMTLLQQLTDDAVASDYPARSDAGERQRPSIVAVVGLAVLGLLLAVAALATRAAAPSTQGERERLVERAQQLASTVADLDARVDAVRAEVGVLEERALNSTETGRLMAARLAAAEAAAGYTAVSGPGIAIDLDDSDRGGRDADLGRVLDRDLQAVVNGLWRAGATAISINGIRLSARTAIRSAGEAILVDYRPLARPYRVEALGNPGLLDGFVTGEAGDMLRDLEASYGVRWKATEEDSIDMPAATSSLPTLAEPS